MAEATLDIAIDPQLEEKLRKAFMPDRDGYNRIMQRALNAGKAAGLTAMLQIAEAKLGVPRTVLRRGLADIGLKARAFGKSAKLHEMYSRFWAGTVGIPAYRFASSVEQTGFHGYAVMTKDGWRTRKGTSKPGTVTARFGGAASKTWNKDENSAFVATMKSGHVGIFMRYPGQARRMFPYEMRTDDVAEAVGPAGCAQASAAAERAANAKLDSQLKELTA